MEMSQVPLALRLRHPASTVAGTRTKSNALLCSVLAGLEAGVSSESDFVEFGLEYGGPTAAACVINWLRDLKAGGALSFVLHDCGKFLAECHGDFADTPFVGLSETLLISPYTFFRPMPKGTSVETGTQSDELLLSHSVARLLLDSRLQEGEWTVLDAINWLSESSPDLTTIAIHGLISLLVRAGICIHARTVSERGSTGTQMWEFHDLLFHTRTTQGHGHPRPQGATHRFLGRIPPESALRTTEWPHHTTLARSKDLGHHITFWEVVKRRRSPPDGIISADAINLTELGQFLSSLAVTERNSTPARSYEVTTRLYPGAGACYELEVFPLILSCEGIERGLYYYNPGEHSLHKVNDWGPELEGLAASSSKATGRIDSPSVVLLLSARFNRVAWKYEGIAYSLCLKDVGVVFHFMYLVGAALGLEVCALGSVEAGLFSQIAGVGCFQEPLVGQFMIVGRRHDC